VEKVEEMQAVGRLCNSTGGRKEQGDNVVQAHPPVEHRPPATSQSHTRTGALATNVAPQQGSSRQLTTCAARDQPQRSRAKSAYSVGRRLIRVRPAGLACASAPPLASCGED